MAALPDRMYRATITRATPQGLYVIVPKLGIGVEYGPCQYSRALLDVIAAANHDHNIQTVWPPGTQVLVTTVNGVPEDLVVLGALS